MALAPLVIYLLSRWCFIINNINNKSTSSNCGKGKANKSNNKKETDSALVPQKRGRGRPPGSKNKYRRADHTPEISVEDNRVFINHAMEIFGWSKPDMTDPEQVRKRICDYFELCARDGTKPGVADFASAFKVHRTQVWKWANGIDSAYLPEESRNFIKEVYEILESLLEKQAQTGDVNPIFSIFLMKNHFGYADKKEYILTPQQPLGDTQTQKALEDKLSDIIESEE